MAAALLQASWSALAAASAMAEESPPGPWLKRWTAEPPMAGNWLGARDVLNGWGIKPSVFYATDLMACVAGSRSSSRRRGYCLTVPLTVFEQWVRPCVVSPTVTSLVEQNWLEG